MPSPSLLIVLAFASRPSASSPPTEPFPPARFAQVEALRDALPYRDTDVVSANGCYTARVRRAPGSEGRPGPLARWRVVVEDADGTERWSALLFWDGSARHWLLSDDGSTFVHVREDFHDFQEVLEILREGRAVSGPSGSAFELDPRDVERTATGKLWLAHDGVPRGTTWLETAGGPRLVLPLVCRDGRERVVDLETGRLLRAEDFAALATVTVTPALEARLAALVERPYVARWVAPARVRAGHPVVVDVVADHPTAGWRFEGFVLVQSGEHGRDLELAPWSRKPVGVAAQALVPVRPRAELEGLAPGRYRLRVVGRASVEPGWGELEVLPADHLGSFRRSGGIQGLAEDCEVLGRGEARFYSERDGARTRCLSRAALARIEELLARLPESSPRAPSEGADFFHYRIVHWRDGLPVELACDERDADPAARELAALLAALR